MPYKAFVSLEKEVHKVTLVFLRLKSLKEKVLEIINNDKTKNYTNYFKIVDNNGEDITSNRKLETAFKTKPVFFFIHFIQNDDNDDEKKYPEEKEEEKEKCHKIVNPLVLLTGASKYKNLDNLPMMKKDLMTFRNLFEEIYGYEVYCTYDPNKPETESLTLNQLNEFLMKYHKNKNKNNYDSLIFVWCGYINTISEKGDILITSDDNRYKPFNKIQELFSFLNKPKIYIKNVYQINGYNNQQYHNCELDTFIIS
ncbi:hypothetical protein RFI_30038 [Reticulomyxa filosa]|uniref:Peptidase C14 caspase domain-containing protein n=1 Tax=Reticulomyxa filosa TaxID=46433 RepID=X6M2X7_RETFI|nr:hypothetical protein RFI_30038 [Reticulomyxa filosa]|eukprot:ETO07355.1 hypothetical protein RFI_30038 [Reticulomyxa filosa]